MKSIFLMMVVFLLGPRLSAEPTRWVRFVNGNQLAGNMIALSTDQLTWQSPLLVEDAQFNLEKVLDVVLGGKPHLLGDGAYVSVQLTNGDRLVGKLVSMEEKEIVLDTWYAGTLHLNRLMVQKVLIEDRANQLYRGPNNLEEWTATSGDTPWKLVDGALVSSGPSGVAMDAKLPSRVSISFTAAWKSNIGFKVLFLTGSIEKENGPNGYALTFQSRNLFLQSLATQMAIGQRATSSTLLESSAARFEIQANAQTGEFCLWIDGQVVEVWRDVEFANNRVGGIIHMISLGSQPIKISEIVISKWDGYIPAEARKMAQQNFEDFGMPQIGFIEANEAEAAKLAENRLFLRNGDHLDGQLLDVTGDSVRIKTPFREVNLPLVKLRNLPLLDRSLERCKRMAGDIRGWFHDGTSVVFRLEDVKHDSLSGSSQNFGKATFQLSSFQRIEFNIYEPDLEAIRRDKPW